MGIYQSTQGICVLTSAAVHPTTDIRVYVQVHKRNAPACASFGFISPSGNPFAEIAEVIFGLNVNSYFCLKVALTKEVTLMV
jgi:hypothetical protein